MMCQKALINIKLINCSFHHLNEVNPNFSYYKPYLYYYRILSMYLIISLVIIFITCISFFCDEIVVNLSLCVNFKILIQLFKSLILIKIITQMHHFYYKI